MQVADLYKRCVRVLWKELGKQATRERIAVRLVARPNGQPGWLIVVHSNWWTQAGKGWRWSKIARSAEELLDVLERNAVPIVRSCLAFESSPVDSPANSDELRSRIRSPLGAQGRREIHDPFLS